MTFHEYLKANLATLARMQFRDGGGRLYTRAVIVQRLGCGNYQARFLSGNAFFPIKLSALVEY